MRASSFAILVILGVMVAGCGDPAGTPCRTRNSSFLAHSSCHTKCIDLWSVVCPNGERLQPAVCAGTQDCAVGSCPVGQLCYFFDDPIEVQSYCLPATVCADAGTNAASLHAWEVQSEREAANARERFLRSRPASPAPLPEDGAP